ncbi:superoxide dismutase family protein [uncultured Jannaschia sp.]|uniref:superoxide dismutase family protein n=1 Tax=uncultured Jannaschia sp. TaxID=293347 RepID=UPI0026017117|nr:superoxide dismutase family protein [uncultured Jannaschia sp.]
MRSLTVALPCLLLAAPLFAQEDTGARVTGELVNAEGANIGSVSIFETPSGLVRVNVQGTELSAGGHGVHMHETGECEGDFTSAGGHIAGDMQHGLVEGGPHPGDLPNGFVEDDGVMSYEAFTDRISIEEQLLDEDGSALIVHSGADDYVSQPSGDAGGRVACAVLTEAPS